jgi:2-amino-4-hydroxy-6-hydroxymethyldihydropteridine diphosphokinase
MSERRANRAYLSLGSNIEPERNLPAAVTQLAAFGRILAVSSVWESAPFQAHASTDRPARISENNFLNAAVLLETDLSPARLYDEAIATIERRLGRVRDPHDKNAPRTIDVDLSLFNRDVFEFAGHRVPDPEIVKRPFVAIPLAELDPDYVHPVERRRLSEIAADWTSNSGLFPRPDVRLQ